jgi:hypothetical protein
LKRWTMTDSMVNQKKSVHHLNHAETSCPFFMPCDIIPITQWNDASFPHSIIYRLWYINVVSGD